MQIADELVRVSSRMASQFTFRHALCTQMRGVREGHSRTWTSFWRGNYENRPAAAHGILQAAMQPDHWCSPFDVLFEAEVPDYPLPADLASSTGAGLQVAILFSNFVSSVDGVVTRRQASAGSVISGKDPPTAFSWVSFACADAVVLGAGTLRATPGHLWTPAHVYPRWLLSSSPCAARWAGALSQRSCCLRRPATSTSSIRPS